MRIAFVSTMDGVPWGGSEELWSQTALRLHEDGHEVMVSTTLWPNLSPKLLALKQSGIEMSLTRRLKDLNLAARAGAKLTRPMQRTRWLRECRPDLVVISQGGMADGLEWMQSCEAGGWRFVTVIQANSELWWPEDDVSIALSKAYSAATKVYGVSRHNLATLENQIGELKNTELAWNPFNVGLDSMPKWPGTEDGWKIACVASLTPMSKGQDLLFQVLSRPQWQQRSIEISLYGKGVFQGILERMVKRLSLTSVHFRGHVEDLHDVWGKNHLLVMPSRLEGLPLALVEAMWCGRAAVVTDVGGNAEMCVDGETGFVAVAAAASTLEDALERAWERRDDWQAMGIKARARAEELIPKDPIGKFCGQLLTCLER